MHRFDAEAGFRPFSKKKTRADIRSWEDIFSCFFMAAASNAGAKVATMRMLACIYPETHQQI
jgi:hypothetical protein